MEPLLLAIRSIYGVPVKGSHIILSNRGPNLQGQLKRLEAAVDKFAPTKIHNGGTPVLVINAKGETPFGGYAITIVTDGKGNFAQRFPSASEMGEAGFDMF